MRCYVKEGFGKVCKYIITCSGKCNIKQNKTKSSISSLTLKAMENFSDSFV